MFPVSVLSRRVSVTLGSTVSNPAQPSPGSIQNPFAFRIWCYVTATWLSAVFFFGLAGVAALVCRSPIEAGTHAFAQPTQRFGKAGCRS